MMREPQQGWLQVERFLYPRPEGRHEVVIRVPLEDIHDDKRWAGLNESILAGFTMDAANLAKRALTGMRFYSETGDTPVPPDVSVVAIWYDLPYNTINVMLSHPSFAAVRRRDQVPRAELVQPSDNPVIEEDFQPDSGGYWHTKFYANGVQTREYVFNERPPVKEVAYAPYSIQPNGKPYDADAMYDVCKKLGRDPDDLVRDFQLEKEQLQKLGEEMGRKIGLRYEQIFMEMLCSPPGENQCLTCHSPKVPGAACECGS